MPPTPGLPPSCSTPFGINGGNTVQPALGLRRKNRCSTPFGINGGNTARPEPTPRPIPSRSTPFGINGGNTATNGPAPVSAPLCSTPFGINGGNTTGIPAAASPRRCAQRLSASTEGTRLDVCLALSVAPVLNAFRHQRREHGFGQNLQIATRQCSTPFGINGGNTPRPPQRPRGSTECSTPFGINGGNTTMRGTLDRAVSGAQRLSASTEGTLVEVLVAHRSSVMCSTPFGINGGNTSPARPLRSGFRVLNAFRHQRREHRRTLFVLPLA